MQNNGSSGLKLTKFRSSHARICRELDPRRFEDGEWTGPENISPRQCCQLMSPTDCHFDRILILLEPRKNLMEPFVLGYYVELT